MSEVSCEGKQEERSAVCRNPVACSSDIYTGAVGLHDACEHGGCIHAGALHTAVVCSDKAEEEAACRGEKEERALCDAGRKRRTDILRRLSDSDSDNSASDKRNGLSCDRADSDGDRTCGVCDIQEAVRRAFKERA